MVQFNDIIMGSIALIIVATIGILGLQTLNNANTTGIPAEQVTLIGMIGVFFIVGIVVSFVVKLKKGKGSN